MDDIILKYRELLRLLEEEYDALGAALDGEILQKYRQILKDEIDLVHTNLRLFYNTT